MIAPVETVKAPATDRHLNLVGRKINRVILHNGVNIGFLPAMRIEKGLFLEASKIAKPPNRKHADELVFTEQGLYCRYGNYEKIVPWANVYEADFEPAA